MRSIRPKSETPEAHPYKLQRGTACLTCRKRKLKCGGEQPECQKCYLHNRKCVYEGTEKWSKPRRLKLQLMQLQRENDQLSQRIAAWEAAEQYASPPITYHSAYYPATASDRLPTSNPPAIAQQCVPPTAYYTTYCPEAASDRLPDPPAITEEYDPWIEDADVMWSYLNIPPVPTLSDSSAMAEEYQHSATPAPEYGSLDFVLSSPAAVALIGGSQSATLPLSGTYRRAQVSQEDRDALLKLFFAHSGQIKVGPTAEEFTSRLDRGEKLHDALLHAMFLTACRFSSNLRIRRQEAKYRQCAQLALEHWDKKVEEVCDCIQAAHLLAHHDYAMDNLAQADHHLLTATSLATTLTGSQGSTPRSSVSSVPEASCAPANPSPTPSTAWPLSASQRRALQQAFTFDRLMAAALGTNGRFPACFGELLGEELQLEKEDKFSRNAACHASGAACSSLVLEAHPGPSPSQPPPMTPEQINTLRAQTAEKVWIVSRARELHQTGLHRSGLAPIPEEKPRSPFNDRDVHSELSAFRDKLPPLDLSNSSSPIIADPFLLSIYTQVDAAMLQAMPDDTTADESKEAFSAVGDVLALICGLRDADYKELDPLMGMYWQWVVEYLLDGLEKSHFKSVHRRFSEAIKLLLIAMGKLADEFPVVSVNMAHVEDRCLRLGITMF